MTTDPRSADDTVDDSAEIVDEIDPKADTEAIDAVEAEVEDEAPSEADMLRAQVQELQQRLIRQQADFDNIRKRLRRESEEAGTRAVVRFVRPMLTELDNFEHALLAANPEKFQDFAMGVTMIKTNLDGLLDGAGISQIPAEGIFDPARHEVLSEIEQADAERGTIVQVARTGYMCGDQVVRAAQVIVAK